MIIQPTPIQTAMVDQKMMVTTPWVMFFERLRRGVITGTLAALPKGLTEKDAGTLFFARDYHHIYEWDGVGWIWGPGDDGLAGSVQGWLISPPAWWVPCNGQPAVTYALSDGTTDTIALPDLTSSAPDAAYVKWGPSVSGPNAAIPPTGTIGAASGSEAVDTGAGSAASDGHTHSLTMNPDGEPRHFQLIPYFRI